MTRPAGHVDQGGPGTHGGIGDPHVVCRLTEADVLPRHKRKYYMKTIPPKCTDGLSGTRALRFHQDQRRFAPTAAKSRQRRLFEALEAGTLFGRPWGIE